jgi:membrane protease YdiL (CAAX protease family)
MTRRISTLASLTGLAIAWGGTALLISPAALQLFGNPSNVPMAFVGQALLWVIAAVVVAIVLFWERQSLASLWLKPFRWQSIAWGLALLAIYYTVTLPLSESVRHAAGLSGFAQGMEQVMRFPISYRIAAVMGAGVVEEALFRGYTVTRLTMLTGNVWLAGGLALIGFAAMHVPSWGWSFAIVSLLGGAVATAFFVWKKDLLAMMVFHACTDAIGLVVAPLFSDWWKDPQALQLLGPVLHDHDVVRL